MPDASPIYALRPRNGVVEGVFDALGPRQDHIAARLGVSPSVVSRIKTFVKQGGCADDYPFERKVLDRILIEARRQGIGLELNDLLVLADDETEQAA